LTNPPRGGKGVRKGCVEQIKVGRRRTNPNMGAIPGAHASKTQERRNPRQMVHRHRGNGALVCTGGAGLKLEYMCY